MNRTIAISPPRTKINIRFYVINPPRKRAVCVIYIIFCLAVNENGFVRVSSSRCDRVDFRLHIIIFYNAFLTSAAVAVTQRKFLYSLISPFPITNNSCWPNAFLALAVVFERFLQRDKIFATRHCCFIHVCHWYARMTVLYLYIILSSVYKIPYKKKKIVKKNV